MACSMVYSKSLLMNVYKTWFIDYNNNWLEIFLKMKIFFNDPVLYFRFWRNAGFHVMSSIRNTLTISSGNKR